MDLLLQCLQMPAKLQDEEAVWRKVACILTKVPAHAAGKHLDASDCLSNLSL